MDCKRHFFGIVLCLFYGGILAQQISVNSSINVQDLIENNLIEGCIEVSNVSSPYNGNIVGLGSFGYFERSSSSFPFENGIVLTTGNANSAGNNENPEILNDGNDSWSTDPDLEAVLGLTGTLNATSIEFNFMSISNQIQFNYILASEEYFGNFPCEYSDGFAFLIREANTNAPYVNIALVPGTNTPVNTNTIHDEIVGFCDATNEAFFEGYNMGDTNYNGRTTVMSATAAIQPNVEYQIKLIIADQTDENYDSAVFIEGNSFDVAVDLGDDFSTCASVVNLDGDIGNAQASYSWFFNGTQITGANLPTLDAIETGNYRVVIDIPLAGGVCTIEDDINLTLSSTQSSDPITDYEICDDISNDGVAVFDLTTKDAEVLASVPPSTYTISYHPTNDSAVNNVNPITTPIQNLSNPDVVYVRIEDTTNGCLAFSTINFVVNALPTIINPTPLQVCDDQTADGFTTIDLNIKNDEITNGQPSFIVNYHATATDAATVSNPLPMPYVNVSTSETVFVSVQNPQTGCVSTTSLDIEVLENPVINTDDHFIDACDSDLDGFANFDLTTIIPEVLQGLTNVTVSFHETNEDALINANPIADDTNYANISSNEQIVYTRVENNTTGCASVTPIELHTNLLLTATNISDVSVCDIDNDGIEEFNFAGIATGIINNLPFNINVDFYLTEIDRDNQTNALDQTVPFIPTSNPQTIYIGITSPTCYETDNFDLILIPIVEFSSINNQTVCDTNQDGFTTVNLSQFDTLVTAGNSGFTVSYFLTQTDATNNTNALPTLYTNTTNPFTVYTRIRSNDTGCADANDAFEISVLEAPVTTAPNPIIICDNDQDGLFTINLTDVIPEIVSSTNERSFSFHTSQQDANSNTNAITNETLYNARTEVIYIRVENTVTGCYSSEILNITVNTLPIFSVIDNYKICEENSDGFGDFIFNTKDAEILNGQVGKVVSYYLNENDANNSTNAIDKDNAYQNISNPQTIYVRVENITDQDCYDTSEFTIEVGTNPLFNPPSDWFVCDDISNDGSEIFDLNTVITEVSNGIADNLTVTFYTSLFNAENSIDALPLQYANITNPQTIFVQVDNGTICNSISSFELNVIQVPEVNASLPITQCDVDYDGFTQFDITQAEFDVLDVRQDNIVISYFENFDDAETDSNPISDPENYTNISNPQTAYIKITNTISNCAALVPIELMVNLPPAINDFMSYDICDNPDNSFDLNTINTVAVNDLSNVQISYFNNANDAVNNDNEISNSYTYTTNSDTVFLRAQNTTTNCFAIYEFILNVNPLPEANQPVNLMACDDDFDGLLEFDLSVQNEIVLNGQSPLNYTVSYHNSIFDATNNIAPLDTNYFAFDSEIIIVRVEDNATGCFALTQFSIIIHPLPIIDIEDQVICLDNFPLVVSAETNNTGDQYLWSTGQMTSEIEITEIGSYWVTITTPFGCVNSRAFEVSISEAATIEATEIIDFSDPNNITVTISGIGDYLYQLDDGEPQESNVFENVAMGYHTLTIIDLNGCAEVTREVLVIDIPKHLSPNNDGQFDRWHIVGVETLPGTVIHIFDRYGKLLKILKHNTQGWDGTFNGLKLPASDYWFVADVKRGNQSFQVKGHFALRR